VRNAPCQILDISGGEFVLHDSNLSGGHNLKEWVEFNIALIWYSNYEHLRPVDPQLMRDTWAAWGHMGSAIPEDIANWLWGEDAQARYFAYTRERNAHPLLRRVRLALARRGLLNSVEWEVHHTFNRV
jgi:hypothetical protein